MVRVWIHLSFLLPLLLLPLPAGLRNQNALASAFRAREQHQITTERRTTVVGVVIRRVRSHIVFISVVVVVRRRRLFRRHGELR